MHWYMHHVRCRGLQTIRIVPRLPYPVCCIMFTMYPVCCIMFTMYPAPALCALHPAALHLPSVPCTLRPCTLPSVPCTLRPCRVAVVVRR